MQLVSQEFKTKNGCYLTLEYTGSFITNILFQEFNGDILFEGSVNDFKNKFEEVGEFLNEFESV